MAEVTFGIISDLHCRLATDAKDSFLEVGSRRVPSGRHPVQSLLDLVDQDHLQVDVLLVPGDLTNKAGREGLHQAWEYCLEIGRKLNAKLIIPVIGNHDIDSRRSTPGNAVFAEVRGMRPDFPFKKEADQQSFFADGYCVARFDDVEIIALNTVVDHTDEASAKRGTFSPDRIVNMEASLTGSLKAPFRVALMHHHPIVHSGAFLDDNDVIPSGDALLSALQRLGCRLIVHGHKHIPRLSIVNGVAVFASGSFSAMLHDYGSIFGNTFHTIRLEGNSPQNVKGQIRTWVFQLGQGWKRSSLEYRGFPFVSGFGANASAAMLVQSIRTLAEAKPGQTRFFEGELLAAAPEIKYLTPSQHADLNQELSLHTLKVSALDDGHIELWRIYEP